MHRKGRADRTDAALIHVRNRAKRRARIRPYRTHPGLPVTAAGRQLRPVDCWTAARWSAVHPVVQMVDAAFSFEDPRALELDELGREVVEEPPPLAEQHGYNMELELIEDPCS